MQHPSPVTCIEFLDPDERFVAVGTTSGDLHLWEVWPSRLVCILRGHQEALWSLKVQTAAVPEDDEDSAAAAGPSGGSSGQQLQREQQVAAHPPGFIPEGNLGNSYLVSVVLGSGVLVDDGRPPFPPHGRHAVRVEQQRCGPQPPRGADSGSPCSWARAERDHA